ncbi:DEKNAAC101727 [Brettanomyces naardenensis]|uniref:DEKNAAC101727 n=1 Tax=Brettanomyces naardenensis TaxID=13370 RepID=A0A448YIP3_BRENA|nr:DEKNAAC101727 [Brettanomyces naardenensis]
MFDNKEGSRTQPEQAQNDPTGGTSGAIIRPYPLMDTFAALAIMMVFPNWLSVLVLVLHILLGNPKFLESSISLFFRHKLSGLHSEADESLVVFANDYSLSSFLSYFSLDSFMVAVLLFVNPSILDYAKLLAKAIVAVRLTSTKYRHIFDAIASSVLLLFTEKLIHFLIQYIQLGKFDASLPFLLSFSSSSSSSPESVLSSSSASSPSASTMSFSPFAVSDLLTSTYIVSRRNPLKLLMYHLSLSNLESASKIAFGFEYIIEFFYSTLAVYTIMHRLNPLLSRLVFYNSISKSLDSLTTVAIPTRLHISHSNTISSQPRSRPLTASSSTSSRNLTPLSARGPLSTAIPRTNGNGRASSLEGTLETIAVPEEVSKSVLPALFSENEFSSLSPSDSVSSRDSDPMMDDMSHSKTPASFPLDQQVGIMNDISSSSLVVAQNFENYCRVVLFPSSIMASTNVMTNSKGKLNPFLEKKMKYMVNKFQQPLWVFVNAARTMFGRKDLYSGDYYQHNAVVATDPTVGGYVRSSNGSPQCFVWYTGETAVAFELRNITLDQLLVRVNGIIWEHVTSADLYGRELVMVNGLSPLSQYDVDFIKILENGELRHFATTTVSTIHKNRTLTESKPSTPLATLQESVVTTQNAIDREKAKLKKLKTDWRKRSTALKAEIESLNNRSNISDESRNYKKVESLRQAVAKLDVEVSNLSKRFEEFYAQQTEVDEKFLDQKRTYESEVRFYKSFEEDYEKKVQEQQDIIKDVTTERNQLLQKKDKLQQKKDRIQNDIDVIERDIEELKTREISLRRGQRKERGDKRERKYLLLMSDINKYENQLKSGFRP